MAVNGILFGALVPSLIDQLTRADCDFYPNKVRALQRDADAITQLSVRGLLSSSEVSKARQRLMKRIAKEAIR